MAMVFVAQQVEHSVVVREVAGSSPVVHPMGKHSKPDDGMQEAKFCEGCGERNNPTAKFCKSCGKELPKKRGGTARIIPQGKHRKKKDKK